MALIDRFRLDAQSGREQPFTFFLCDRDDYRRNSATALVRGMLYHVLKTHTHARRFLRTEYDKQKASLVSSPNSLYSLWRIFKQVLSSFVSHQHPLPTSKRMLIF